MNLSQIKIRLRNINKKATKFVSFVPSDIDVRMQEFYMSPTMRCLEDFSQCYKVDPESDLMKEWNIYAYDESVRNYRALEGDLLFCSSSTIKMEGKYRFNLTVLPYFLTCMRKFKGSNEEDIRFAENLGEERNLILINSKIDSILSSVDPHSIVLIDGPLVGGNASTYIVRMDEELRKRDCIPPDLPIPPPKPVATEGTAPPKDLSNFSILSHRTVKSASAQLKPELNNMTALSASSAIPLSRPITIQQTLITPKQ